MTKQETYKEFLLIFKFMNPDVELKAWHTCEHYHAHYREHWDSLMPVVMKISDELHYSLNQTLEYLSETQERDGLYTLTDVYKAIVEYLQNKEDESH